MLTVVVPATDNPSTLDRCLGALSAALEGPDELIVVDRAPAAGFAAARRAGVESARGDVIAFVDSDVLIHPDALARLTAAFEHDPSLAAVVGSYDDAPEAPGTVSRFRNLLHHHVHQSSPGSITSFWGGLGAVRRVALEAVGGFDPRERWLDDVDLGMRLAAAGFKIELRPDIQGTHLKRWTLRSMIWTDFALRGVPWVQLLLRHRTLPTELNLGWRHRASAASALAAAGALAARRPLGTAVALGALVALNRQFYAFLLRREGPARAAAAVGLHAVHHLAAVAGLAGGLAAYASRQVLSSRTHRTR
jgi:GT2 family glycosyltransferase